MRLLTVLNTGKGLDRRRSYQKRKKVAVESLVRADNSAGVRLAQQKLPRAAHVETRLAGGLQEEDT